MYYYLLLHVFQKISAQLCSSVHLITIVKKYIQRLVRKLFVFVVQPVKDFLLKDKTVWYCTNGNTVYKTQFATFRCTLWDEFKNVTFSVLHWMVAQKLYEKYKK